MSNVNAKNKTNVSITIKNTLITSSKVIVHSY